MSERGRSEEKEEWGQGYPSSSLSSSSSKVSSNSLSGSLKHSSKKLTRDWLRCSRVASPGRKWPSSG